MSSETKKVPLRFENSAGFAKELDLQDPLHHFRNHFFIPHRNGSEQIYFLGNSLGLQCRNMKGEIDKILGQWSEFGVEGFFMGSEPWINFHDQLTQSLSTILGTLPSELTIMNQLTVNLHLMMVSFYRPMGKRNKILCEAKAFPSDQYMFETHLHYHGLDADDTIIEVSPRQGEQLVRADDILAAIDKHKDELVLVLFSGVNYYTGQAFDIKTITKASHEIGAIAGFDLAHAAGNIRLSLHDWGVDFGCWCGYKYLNAGPGAMGGAYIHERFHDDKTMDRFGGWWGNNKAARFKMEKVFQPIPTAEGWQLSTPSLILYACHRAALNMFEKAGWENLQAKQQLLNKYLWFILEGINQSLSKKMIEFITPRNETERGCQVSMLMLEKGREVYEKLTMMGVMADWREPNVIRIAPVPLYNTFEEIWRFGNIVESILNQ